MNGLPLRVLHVIAGLGQGGAEAVLARLVSYPAQAVTHTVVSLTDMGLYGDRLRAAGVEVHALGMARGRLSITGFLMLRRLIVKTAPDVVQTWMYHADLLGGLAARLAGVRAVAWGIRNSGSHLSRSSRSARGVLKLCARLSRWVPRTIVCAAQNAMDRHAEKGYYRAHMEVIANGYDLSRYAPNAAARQAMRAQWGQTQDALLIGCVARWDPLKDHANLLRAIAALMRDGRDAGLRCVLVGRDMTADNTELMALIAHLQLQERILLMGASDDVPAVMNALDIHVLSSCAEGFPNVVAEAMACETYCVVTDVGDAALIVGDTGIVVPPEQSEALAQGIATAVDTVLAASGHRVGVAGRYRVLDHFDLGRMVAAYLAVWRRITEERA